MIFRGLDFSENNQIWKEWTGYPWLTHSAFKVKESFQSEAFLGKNIHVAVADITQYMNLEFSEFLIIWDKFKIKIGKERPF